MSRILNAFIFPFEEIDEKTELLSSESGLIGLSGLAGGGLRAGPVELDRRKGLREPLSVGVRGRSSSLGLDVGVSIKLLVDGLSLTTPVLSCVVCICWGGGGKFSLC